MKKYTPNFEEFVNEQQENSMNEGSYDDFLVDNGREIKDAIKNIDKIRKKIDKDTKGMSDEEFEEYIMKPFSEIENIYDQEVADAIDGWVLGGKSRVTPRDIADVGLNILNRHGTEMSMVLQAIDQFKSNIRA